MRPSWPEAGEDGYADNVRRVWESVPESVRAFYERTHDGFGMFPDADYRLYRLGRVRPVYGVLDVGYEEPEVAGRTRHCYMFYEDASGAPFTLDILADRVERAGDLWRPDFEARVPRGLLGTARPAPRSGDRTPGGPRPPQGQVRAVRALLG